MILFVQTHSDKERGDLFYCGDDMGEKSQSTNISDVRVYSFSLNRRRLTEVQFFTCIIGPKMREYIMGRSYSALIMCVCGSVVTIPSAVLDLRNVVDEYVTSYQTSAN